MRPQPTKYCHVVYISRLTFLCRYGRVAIPIVVARVSMDIQLIKHPSVARVSMDNSGAQDTCTGRPNLAGKTDDDSTDTN